MPNWVGDVLMATPSLRALRKAHPQAEITVSARSFVRELVEGLPSVDHFAAEPPRGVLPLVRHARELRAGGFDWAVLLPDSTHSALAPFLARIPVRCGYAREPLRRALITQALDPPRQDGKRLPISMIERYQRITRALGCPDVGTELEIAVPQDARASLSARLTAEGVDPARELLVVTPGASFGASKLWPSAHFADACDRLSGERGLLTVLAPGPGEEDVSTAIAGQMCTPSVPLVDPVTTLAELAALLDRAALVLTNDTGPRHMAVALGTPVIALLGPTDPRHTNHLLEQQRVLREDVECSPCHQKICPIDHRCMTRLRPERVVAAAKELLA
jgi:heptosyltransferase-2